MRHNKLSFLFSGPGTLHSVKVSVNIHCLYISPFHKTLQVAPYPALPTLLWSIKDLRWHGMVEVNLLLLHFWTTTQGSNRVIVTDTWNAKQASRLSGAMPAMKGDLCNQPNQIFIMWWVYNYFMHTFTCQHCWAMPFVISWVSFFDESSYYCRTNW